MQLAVSPSAPGMPAADLVKLCVESEHLGYRDCWLAEVAGPESFALAGAIATATKTMDLGIAVVAAANRSPALHAMGAATISQLLNGRRFALGVGSSSEVIVEEWHGRSFERPLTQVREAVEGTRAVLQGDREYRGRTTSMARYRLASTPRGPVDLYVGALGPGMLRVAGAVADGVCLNLMPPSVVPRQLAEISAGAAGAGRELPADFGVMARLHTMVSDDLEHARDVIRQAFGPYFAQPVYNRFLAWCGFPGEAERIAAAFANGDRAGVATAMHDDLVDAIALVGPVGRVKERLAAYAEAGITVAALNVIARSEEHIAGILDQLAN